MKVMVDPALPEHRKIARLAGALKIQASQALGHLVALWCRVMAQAETGVLTGWTDAEISAAALWRGKPTAFVAALKAAALLDRQPKGGYSIHDWIAQQGDLIQKRQDWRARQERHRRAKRDILESHAGVTSDKSHVTRESRVPVPSPSLLVPPVPSPTIPDRAEAADAAPPALRSGSAATLIASAYTRMNAGVISLSKATALVQFALDRGVNASDLETAMHDPARCRGFKIWEVIDPLAPDKHTIGKSVVQQILDKWKMEDEFKTPGGNHAEK